MSYDTFIHIVPFIAVAALVASISYFFAYCGEPREYWLWHNVLHLL